MNVLDTLNTLVGRELQPTTWAPVNTAMIRHWVEAMGDTNPIYLGAEPGEVRVDMPVEPDWIDADPELTLPAFRPVIREEN